MSDQDFLNPEMEEEKTYHADEDHQAEDSLKEGDEEPWPPGHRLLLKEGKR